MSDRTQIDAYQSALAAHDAGLCAIRPKIDGSKAPLPVPNHGRYDATTGKYGAGWERYQTERPSRITVEAWFKDYPALGIVCGSVSGDLQMFELEGRMMMDEPRRRRFAEALARHGALDCWGRMTRGYLETTPGGGVHALAHVPGHVAGNMKLASCMTENGLRPLIETRGEGGFVVVAPSNGPTHPTGKPWTLRAGGFASITTVTVEEWNAVLEAAMECNEVASPEATVPTANRLTVPQPWAGGEVGDSWMDVTAAHLAATDGVLGILLRHGWTRWRDTPEMIYVTRPIGPDEDKQGGTSAQIKRANGRLINYSSSVPEFEAWPTFRGDPPEKVPTHSYDAADVLAVYEYDGDRQAALRFVAEQTGIYDAWLAEQRAKERAFFGGATAADEAEDDSDAPESDDEGSSTDETSPPPKPADTLPERFWSRPNHAAVRDAAFQVGVSPEALMLAVIVMVAAHVPAGISFPGKRRGATNLLGTIIGAPGWGKGSTLDRAQELVPLPNHARTYKPGTAQGLVKEFYEYVPVNPKDPDGKKMLKRHLHPVFLRVDEITKFTAAARTGSERGDALIGELKQSVFGEGLGQSVATDEKRLQCEPHTYRLDGLLGVAPSSHAGTLFDDTDGGFPQRLLFANLLRPDQKPTDTLGGFDDMAHDDDEADGGGGRYTALRPLQWSVPRAPRTPSFTDSKKVAARMAEMVGTRWRLLDAHVPYLTHGVAAVLAFLDGRWLIQPADLTLAGDVVKVSQVARGHLLGYLDRAAATGDKKKRDRQVATTVATQTAVLDLQRLDGARAIVATARALTEEKGEPPTVRELRRKRNDAGRFELELAEAIKPQGWLRVESRQTSAGGSPKQVVIVTEKAP